MFRIGADEGSFHCDFPEEIAAQLDLQDKGKQKMLSKLLARVEHLLGAERIHLSLMLPSLNLHLLGQGMGQKVVNCQKIEGGLRWSTSDLTEGERIAASAYLAVLAHLINLDMQKSA